MSRQLSLRRVGRTDPSVLGMLAVAVVFATSWVSGIRGPLGRSSVSGSSDTTAPVAAAVPQALEGEWHGNFGEVKGASLRITKFKSAVGAVLINPPFRETFRVTALDGRTIMLVPLGVTSTRGSATQNYSLDTMWLEMSADGSYLVGRYRDARGTTGGVTMRRASRGKRDSGTKRDSGRIETSSNVRSAEKLEFNAPFAGHIDGSSSVRLTLHIGDSPACEPSSQGDAQCDITLYSGGRPNNGTSPDDLKQVYSKAIDEVDVTMTLLSSGGTVVASSSRVPLIEAPGYQQVMTATLPPGEYVLVVSGRTPGTFSILWST